MAKDQSWTCPYCSQVATLQSHNMSGDLHSFDLGNKLGKIGVHTLVHVCPNSKCREFTIVAKLSKVQPNPQGYTQAVGDPIITWNLKPQSSAKPFPSYIPAPILQDYNEACLIAS